MSAVNSRERVLAARPGTPAANGRRSLRVVIDFPVTVFGQKLDGTIFAEPANTLTVNAHGALVKMKTDIDSQKPALIGNPKTRMEVQCRVVYRKELEKNLYEIGLEFAKPFPKFWGINFPPEDWDPAERKRAASPQKPAVRSPKGTQ